MLHHRSFITRKILLFTLIVAAFLLPHSSAIAAQTSSATCDPASLINQLSSLKSTGRKNVDLRTLDDIMTLISDQRIACNGLTFSGTGSRVLDPFTVPAGDYRVRLIAGNDIALTIKALGEGLCSGNLTNDIFETVVSTNTDCRATIATVAMNKNVEWTITFEPIK